MTFNTVVILKISIYLENIVVYLTSHEYNNIKSALVYMVRIPGFHPGGPGSIPGCGTFYINQNFMISIILSSYFFI